VNHESRKRRTAFDLAGRKFLKCELAWVTEERDISKKAPAHFARDAK